MPRNPGARKHQHNNRHENGLVGPGKRVTRQRSNGHLNGSAKGPVPDETAPSTSISDQPVTVTALDTTSTAPTEPTNPTSSAADQPVLSKNDSDLSQDGQVQEQGSKWETTNGSVMTTQRRSDAFLNKAKSSQDFNAFQIASTILRSRPACDTIALLVVLLALPSIVLTIVQALFASLTLMPGAGVSPIAFLSSFDVFQGSVGSPSLNTMLVIDVICFGLWICLWNWAQNFALDLAQIQIAITLGNGSSGKSSSINTFCFLVVLLLHSARSKGVRNFLISHLVPADLLSNSKVAYLMQYLPSDSDFGDSPGSPSKIRSLFAIHVISQAVMAFVRRRVASTQANSSARTAKRLDVDGSAGVSGAENANVDGPAAGATSGIDYQPPPTPGLRDSKDRGVSAKKRRRQATHVRSRQPFWAALASTKVHVFRELEHNRGLPSAATNERASTEPSCQDLVSVTSVDPSTILFDCRFPSAELNQGLKGHDSEKPLFVRINGARWHSVSIERLQDYDRSQAPQSQWSGEISGLAPNCTYTCSFIRTDTDEEFASVLVKTPALLDRDLQPTMSPAPVRQSSRPLSPTTTLKNSITNAEAKLSDARKRLGQAKKQHKGSLNKVDREVDNLESRLESAGDDTKSRQKLQQIERNIKQTEKTANSLKSALENLEAVPEEESEEHVSRKAAFDNQRDLLLEATQDLQNCKSAAENDLSCVNGELTTITTRKDRLTSRQTKLVEQHDRITQANAQGLNEKERRAAESVAREADQMRREADLQSQMHYLANELREIQMRVQSNYREIDALEKQDQSQRQKMLMNSGPLTPEGDLPGTRPLAQNSRPLPFGSFNSMVTTNQAPEPKSSPFLAYAKTLPSESQRRPRSDTNRSIGAMSNFSADFEDADPIPPMPSTSIFDATTRKGSNGSRERNSGSPAAGIIGNLRSPQRGSQSPGHMPGSTTW